MFIISIVRPHKNMFCEVSDLDHWAPNLNQFNHESKWTLSTEAAAAKMEAETQLHVIPH